MDVAGGGNQRIAQLASRGLLDERRLAYLTETNGTAEADIEDVLDVNWYVKLLAASLIDLPAPRHVPRLPDAALMSGQGLVHGGGLLRCPFRKRRATKPCDGARPVHEPKPTPATDAAKCAPGACPACRISSCR